MTPVIDDCDLTDPCCINTSSGTVKCRLVLNSTWDYLQDLDHWMKPWLDCAMGFGAAVIGAHPTATAVFPQPCLAQAAGAMQGVLAAVEQFRDLALGQPVGGKCWGGVGWEIGVSLLPAQGIASDCGLSLSLLHFVTPPALCSTSERSSFLTPDLPSTLYSWGPQKWHQIGPAHLWKSQNDVARADLPSAQGRDC